MPPPFALDPRLEATSVEIAAMELCQLRLSTDGRWPWLVLVPMRHGLIELEDLTPPERGQLFDEITAAGAVVRAVGDAVGAPVEKLNVGALGNVVSQLHVHVVGRRRDDPAWPGPVWGFAEARPYEPRDLERARLAAVDALIAPRNLG